MALLIDMLILLLLAGTLGYAFMVERRVRTLMAALKDLQPVVGELSSAVDKSENSVVALKSVADRVAAEAPRAGAA
ncbi:MAG: flagellar motor switch protein, partial [Paracoccaceae bacterium]